LIVTNKPILPFFTVNLDFFSKFVAIEDPHMLFNKK
jgi:hypothetical protein